MPKERKGGPGKRPGLGGAAEPRARRELMAAAAAEAEEKDDAAAAEEDGGFISASMSRRIVELARAQHEEEEGDEDEKEDDDDDEEDEEEGGGGRRRVRFGVARSAPAAGVSAAGRAATVAIGKKTGRDEAADEEEEEEEVEEGEDVDVGVDYGDESALAAEEAILRRFMPDAPVERRTLADIIMEKFEERKAAEAAAAAGEEEGGEGGGGGGGGATMDPKVVEVYTEVGRFLSHYKSGKLPKVFKIIPGLASWEEVLFLTNPETWTPHATYAATRIFASNFNPAKAQRFFNLILLPKCRDDVYFNKRLNFHLYLALKKAAYKPAAFYKGIILPLAAAPDATLREAVILGSVIGKVSLPQLHSAATIIKMCQMRYTGAVSVLLRVRTFVTVLHPPHIPTPTHTTIHAPTPRAQMLLNKKYTLPYMAVDEVVKHFEGFATMAGPMPTIWHQCLLTFVQRYKSDLTAAQKDALRDLMHVHTHHAITPEVRREMYSVGCRGEALSLAPSSGAPARLAAAPPAAAAAAAAVAPAPAGGAGGGARHSRPPPARAMDIEY